MKENRLFLGIFKETSIKITGKPYTQKYVSTVWGIYSNYVTDKKDKKEKQSNNKSATKSANTNEKDNVSSDTPSSDVLNKETKQKVTTDKEK